MTDGPFDGAGPLDPAASEVRDARAGIGRYPGLETRLYEFFAGHPSGFQMIANPVAAVSLTPPDDALSAVVQVQNAAVRFTLEGTTPTAAVGHRGAVGDVVTLTGHVTIKAAQFINEGGAAASLAVTYFN